MEFRDLSSSLPSSNASQIPEAQLSYLGDNSISPSKDGGSESARPPLGPAGIILQCPLAPLSLGPGVELSLFLVCQLLIRLSLPPMWVSCSPIMGTLGGTGPHPKPRLPATSPIPSGSLGQNCAQAGGAGPRLLQLLQPSLSLSVG